MAGLIVLPDKVKIQLAIEAAKRDGYSDTKTKEVKIRSAIKVLNEFGPEELIIRGLVTALKEVKPM